MAVKSIVVFFFTMSLTTAAMEGFSNNEDWAFQWYTGEPFRFKCQSSGLNITSSDIVLWDTPTRKSLPDTYTGDDYELLTAENIKNVELLVKKIQAEFHGVYTCYVHNRGNNNYRGKVVYGLNIRDVKYHDMTDKYRNNIIVAFVATAVFVVPLATILFLWHFRYEERKSGNGSKRSYSPDNEMKNPYTDLGLNGVKSPEGEGAYENQISDDSTQL